VVLLLGEIVVENAALVNRVPDLIVPVVSAAQTTTPETPVVIEPLGNIYPLSPVCTIFSLKILPLCISSGVGNASICCLSVCLNVR